MTSKKQGLKRGKYQRTPEIKEKNRASTKAFWDRMRRMAIKKGM